MITPDFLPKETKSQYNPIDNYKIQTKLEVTPPHDKYEQEADNVADKVSRMPGNFSDGLQMVPKEDEEKKVQMQPEEDEESIKMKPEDEEKDKDKIQRFNGNSANKQVPQVSSALTANIESTKGQGNSLPENVTQEMNQKIGADFSNVRIHNDAGAVQMNKELGAQAFTHGNDIYFNSGKYNPESSSGKHLLVHELTHTLQQAETSAIQNKVIQCEWEIAPTVANPVVRVLTAEELRRALNWDRAAFTDADEITLLRTILGESGTPAVVDEDFVRAVVSYQAAYGLEQDGIVGANTAGQLAAELGVEATSAGADADVGDATTMALNPAQRRMRLRSRVHYRLGRLLHQSFVGSRENPSGIVTVQSGINASTLFSDPTYNNAISINYTGNNADNAHWLQFVFAQLSAVDPTTNNRVYQTGSVPNSGHFPITYSNGNTFHWSVDTTSGTNMYYEAGGSNIRTPGHDTAIFDQPAGWNGDADSLVATLGGRPNRTRLILGFDTYLVVNNRCTYHVRWNMYFNYHTATAPTPDVPGSYETLTSGPISRLPGNRKTVLDTLFPGNTVP